MSADPLAPTDRGGRDQVMLVDAVIGRELGGYVIESFIGRGGMGVVCRAVDKAGRAVALKLMMPDLIGNADLRERFVRESRIGIDHPNVVPIYGAGEDGGILYIAMKLVQGPDLKTVITSGGRLLPTRTARLMGQAAQALDAAHEAGIVHRDVKPQNMLLEKREEVEHLYLTDFGLVKTASSRSSLTDSMYLMGSVHYMAPEQIEGNEVDGRTDVYALGCAAYECLTGAVPFDKPSEVAVLWAHVNDPVPRVSEKVPTLSEGLDDVVGKALAKSPDDRYLTAGEFTAALKRAVGLGDERRASVWSPGRVPRPRHRPSYEAAKGASPVPAAKPRRAGAFAAGVLSGLLVLGFLVEITTRGGGDGRGAISSMINDLPPWVGVGVDDSGGRAFTDNQGVPRDDHLRKERIRGETDVPDAPQGLDGGGGVPYTPSRQPPSRPTAGGGDPRRVDEPGGAKIAPVALPPSLATTRVAFATWRHAGSNRSVTGAEIYLMNADGTNLKRLTWTDPAEQEVYPVISPDGTQVAFVRFIGVDNADLFVVDSGGAYARPLTRTPACEIVHAWSPDGTKILFSRNESCLSSGTSDLWVLDLESGAEHNLTSSPERDEWGGTWSPDGRRIALVRGRNIYTAKFLGDKIGRVGPGITGHEPDWCRGGSLVFAGENGIAMWDPATNVVRHLTTNSAQYGDSAPSCSPDGRKVVFETFREGRWQIYVMNSDGSNETNLTRSEFGEHHPDWQGSF